MSKDLTVKILGDSKSLEAALGRSAKKTSTWSKTAERAGKVGVAALGALGFAAYKSVEAASDLNEQMSKTGQVFGKSAKQIQKWSETTATGIGISRTEALAAAGTFGNMLVPMGFARSKAADLSRSMVDLAGDMASFNNASPEETLDALRSGLAGETEPLRKYGVFLNQARVQQELLNMGIHKSWTEVTAAQKAQATYNIIMKDTKDTQGDFERTSSGLANQQRILRAQITDLSAELGNALIPVLLKAANVSTRLIGLARQHTGATKVLIGVLATLAAGMIAASVASKIAASAFLRYLRAIRLSTVAVRAFTAANIALDAVLSANPYVAVALLVIALGAAFVVAWKKSATFRRYIQRDFEGVKQAALAVWSAINQIVDAVERLISAIGRIHFPSLPNLPNIPGIAGGTQSWRGGYAMVGERGPELVNLPAGSRVWTAAQTAAMTSRGSSGGTGTQIIRVVLDGRQVAEAVVRRDKVYQRQNGRGLFA